MLPSIQPQGKESSSMELEETNHQFGESVEEW